MENIHTATAMVTQGCYMANIDLKDAWCGNEVRGPKVPKTGMEGVFVPGLHATFGFSLCAFDFHKSIETNSG